MGFYDMVHRFWNSSRSTSVATLTISEIGRPQKTLSILLVISMFALSASIARADVRTLPKVRIDVENLRPAETGKPFVTTIEVVFPRDGVANSFTLAGEDWTVSKFDVPQTLAARRGESLSINVGAVPQDTSKPLTFSFVWEGETISETILLSKAYLEKRLRPYGLQWRPGTMPVEAQATQRGKADRNGPDRESGGECANMNLTIRGRFVYERFGEDCAGAGECTPADGITVRIVDSDLVFDETMWESQTNSNGDFLAIFNWDDCDIFGCDCPDIYVEFEADTDVVTVQSSDILEIDYSWSTDDNVMEDFTGTNIDFGTLLPADPDPGELDTNPAVHIHNSITLAHLWVLINDGTNVEEVDVQWPDGDTGAFYNTFFEEIHVSVGRQWREDTHTHEYGHHFLENYSTNPSPDYCNDICDDDGCGHCIWCEETDHDAWNEGWPNWLADVVTRAYSTLTFDGYAPLFTRSQERLLTCSEDGLFGDPLITEGFAGALCRDIEDLGEDADGDGMQDIQPLCASDSLAIGANEIFEVVRLDQPENVLEFITAFRNRFPNLAAGLWRTANSIGGPAYTWPDTMPPGIVTTLTSSSHPMGVGGTLPEITVDWFHAPDDASGSEDYSIVWDTSPLEPDFTPEISGETTSTSPPAPVGTQLYISLRARDCLENWSNEWSSFGPFLVTECNNNGIVDVCEVNCAAFNGFCNVAGCGQASDCNANVNPDSCDIDSGDSSDCNANGQPDECEGLVFAVWDGCTVGPPPQNIVMCQWHVASNWTDNVVPDATDHACIEQSQSTSHVEHTAQSGSTVVRSLGCYEPFILSGGTFAPIENAAFFSTLNMTNGTLTGSGDVLVDEAMTWGGGTISTDGGVPGDMVLDGGLNLTGFVSLTGERSMVNNQTAAMTTASSWLRLRENASFRNIGVFDANADGTIDWSTGAPRFVNEGVFNKNGSQTQTISARFVNAGNFNINDGIAAFSGLGLDSTGQINGAPMTTLRFLNGPSILQSNSDTSAANLHVQNGNVDVFGTFEADESTTVGGGTLTFRPTANLIDVGDALTITGGTMNVSCGESVSVDTYTQSGGTFNGTSGHIDVADLLTWTGGTMTTSNNAKLVTNVNGDTLIQGFVTLGGDRTLNNTQAATFSTASAWLRLTNNAVFNNTGTFNALADGTIDWSGGSPVFNNQGVYNKMGLGTQSVTARFDNSNQISISNGTLSFGGLGLTSSGDIDGTGNATLRFVGSEHILLPSSNVTLPNLLVQSGTVQVNGMFDLSGDTTVAGGSLNLNPPADLLNLGTNLSMTGGTIDISCGEGASVDTYNQSGGTFTGFSSDLTISGATTLSGGTMTGAIGVPVTTSANGDVTIDGFTTLAGERIFNSAATVSMIGGTAWLRLNNSAAFNNNGTFNAEVDGNINASGVLGQRFTNNGTYNKNGPATQNVSVAFTNNGDVNINSGTVSFAGQGFDCAGTVSGVAGSTLQLAAGNHAIAPTGELNVARFRVTGGTTQFNGTMAASESTTITSGTLNFNVPANLIDLGQSFTMGGGALNLNSGESVEVDDCTLTGGTISGATADFNVTGPMTWSGGTFTTSGGAPAITTVAGDLQIDGFATLGGTRTFTSQATATMIGASAWLRINNNAVFTNDGTFNAEVDGNIDRSGGSGQFVNNGAYNKRGLGAQNVSVRFINNGDLRLENGTMNFTTQGYRQNGGATILDGGNLNSNVTVNIQDGEVRGSGMISADTTNAARFSPGVSPGVIDIDGDYTQTKSGALHIELGGLAPGTQHDVLNVTDDAFLNGTLDIDLINAFTPSIGDTFIILNCDARFGQFLSVQSPTVGGVGFDVVYNPDNVTLVAVASSAGDCDDDGDIDLIDFDAHAGCVTGPDNGPIAPMCDCTDFDGDGDVDLLDWGLFQSGFTGSE